MASCVAVNTPICCVRELIVLPCASWNRRDVVLRLIDVIERAVKFPELMELVKKFRVLKVLKFVDV